MKIQNIVGGKWWKIDFHVHTPGSYDYGKGDQNQKSISPQEFLKCCMKKELDCVVITDHNTVEWIPELRSALDEYREHPDDEFRELVIFPGMEITVQGNIHVLGIFDPSTKYEELVKITGKIDYDDKLQTTKTAINKVIEIISQNHGIAIPAHVDQPSGLFYSATSSSLQRAALDTNNLLALEVIDNDFSNSAYTESKKKLSYIAGSDAHTTNDIAEKYTWVKMGDANIEALKLALYDAKDSTIRSIETSGNPNNIRGRTYIKSISISSGKIIGRSTPLVIQFSPWHNCLIGGRGSGKSSILKFIRLLLNRQSELPSDIKSEFDNFAKIPANRGDLGILLQDTEVVLEMVVDGVENRLCWKNGKTYEIKEDGTEIECIDIVHRFPVKMFSQKQLFELTKNTNMLMDYIDEDWDIIGWQEEYNDIKLKYKKCQNNLAGLRTKQSRREQLLVELEDLGKKISVFETDETKQLLSSNTQLSLQKNIIEKIHGEYSDLITVIESVKTLKLQRDTTEIELLDKETKEKLVIWIEQLNTLQKDLHTCLQRYSSIALSTEELIQQLPINELITANSLKLNELLATLLDNGVEGIDQYKTLIEEREKLLLKLKEYPDLKSEILNQEMNVSALIERLKLLIKRKYVERCRVIDKYNSDSNLRITLKMFADIDTNEAEFRRIIQRATGFESDILQRNPNDETPNGGFIFRSCCYGDNKTADEMIDNLFAEKDDFISSSGKYAKKFISFLEKAREKSPEIDHDTMLWIPDDRLFLEIKLPGNKYQSVDSSSPGQRTSAILSLILRRGKYPIVIDQPEDDLDTRNITDIVVNGISEMKADHQFIIVTHNPNIVVNTNSEQVVQLDVRGGQIQTACSGALQSHAVRDAICEVMEGGREALEKRYFRIIKALSN